MATHPKVKSPPTSSVSGNGLRSSPLERARRVQTEAMEDRTVRRVGELLGKSPEKSQVLSKEKSTPSVSRTSSGSPLLEYVRRSQTEAMASRTAQRISEINAVSNQGKVDGDSSQVNFYESDEDDLVATILEDRTHRSPPSYLDAIGASSNIREAEFSRVPESAMRRNITQRRSRGKVKDDSLLAPDASMVSRRPRSRSKDR